MDVRASLSFELVNELLVIIHTQPEPDEADWNAMIEHVREQQQLRGVLVVAPGAKPNPSMRADIQHMHEHFGTKAAVLTASKVTKGVLVALSWFSVPIKGFSHDQLDDALDYLGRSDMCDTVRALLDQTQQRATG